MYCDLQVMHFDPGEIVGLSHSQRVRHGSSRLSLHDLAIQYLGVAMRSTARIACHRLVPTVGRDHSKGSLCAIGGPKGHRMPAQIQGHMICFD